MLIRPAAPERVRPSRPRTRPAESGRELVTTIEQDFGPDSKSGSGKFETPNRSAFVARRQSFWSVRGKRMGMSAWQRLKSFSGQNRSTPGTSNRQERGSHDTQPCDSSSKDSQAPPADHPTYRHRMIEIVPRQHAAQRAAVRSCSGQGSRIPAPRDRNAQVEGGVGRIEPGLQAVSICLPFKSLIGRTAIYCTKRLPRFKESTDEERLATDERAESWPTKSYLRLSVSILGSS